MTINDLTQLDAADVTDTAQPEAATDTTTVDDERPDAEIVDTDDAETFPAQVVRDLRKENASHRDKARAAEANADAYAKRLHEALVAATGRLEDPSDLAFAPEHLDDSDALLAAIEKLVAAKPHLKARKASGDAGQGNRGASATGGPSFASLIHG